jgi:putative chitinase
MTDWTRVLRAIAPRGKRWIIAGLADAMPRAIEIAALDTPRRLAHFLAQLAHESDGFATTVEYASGDAYEGRRDLGNVRPGDGRRFKGRGLVQLTGRANYRDAGAALGLDLEAGPDQAARFPAAALTAALYWRKRAINADADADDVRAVTKKINGGYNGLAQRAAYLKAAKRALAAPGPAEPAAPADALTARDLRRAGSRTIAGADQVKSGLASLATAGAAATGVASQVSDIAGQVQGAAESVQSAAGALAWAQNHWKLLALAALLGAVVWGAWRVWRGAALVTRARVDDARANLNVGR